MANVKTPEQIEDDEGRTNSMGLFNTAEAYWMSAVALEEAKVRCGHADSPVRFLYYHSIELYLKAFLREKGHSVDELCEGKKFGHHTTKITKRTEELGLSFTEEDREVFAIMGDTDAVIRSRYIRTGPFTWPTFEALNATCENLRGSVGAALKKAGVNVRL